MYTIQLRKHKIFKWLFIATVVVPNFLELVLISGGVPPFAAPAGFVILVILSPYYMPMASVFGKSIFLTETVIAPHGIEGVLLSVVVYSVPYLLWWIFIIRPR